MKEKSITTIRDFNRFYTRIIGLLDQYILNSRYSLPEVRVLYELYHQENLTAGEIVTFIGIDKGYLSRILRQFENKKLILKKRSDKDGRSTQLSLTRAGVVEFELLNKASHDQIREILDGLTEEECDKLVRNMAEIKMILSKTRE